MKKIIFIMLLAIIGFGSKTMGQGTCISASNITPNTTNNTIPAGTTEAWYMYNAITPNLSIQINTLEDTNLVSISGIYLYTGDCGNLNQIASSNNANNIMLTVENLNAGSTYYIKISKGVSANAVKFSVNDNSIILNCTENPGCHDLPSQSCDLVCNGNFEYYSFIPTYISQIGLACPWGSVNSSNPDYYNGDASGNPGMLVDVPSNFAGNQNSYNYSTGDKGYAGFGVGMTDASAAVYQEYVFQKLKHPLIAGVTYNVSFKVSRADNYKMAVNNIGAFLSSNNPYVPGAPGTNTGNISYIPSQTYIHNSFITDATNWTTISYQYTPTISGIQYIVIGGFGHVDTKPETGNVTGSYYYLDEVHITAVDQIFTITANPNPICIGQSTTLTNNLNAAINWSAAPNCNISCPTNCVTTTATPTVNTVFTGTLTISPGCTKTATTTVNVVPPPIPTITGKTTICINTNVIYSTEPNMTNYTWNISGGTIVSGNGTNTVTVVWNTNGNQTISVNYSNGVCMANSPTVLNVTVGPPPAPIFTGFNNNCDAYQTPAVLTNYTVTNVNPNYSYTWYANQGTINGANNNTNVNVMWNQNISNSTPATITVVVSDPDKCSNTTLLDVYNCCQKGNIGINNTIISNPSQIITSGGNTVVINGIVTLNCSSNVNLSNQTILFGPYAKLIIAPNNHLTIDNSSQLIAGCGVMWDGIYVSDPTSQTEVVGNSSVKHAINGLVSENGGIITTNDATLKDNYYSIRVKNTHDYYPVPGLPYTPYPGSIKNTRFEGNTNLPYPPYFNKKSLAGIDCNNANNFTIGDDAATALRNYFSDMRFGIYANNSDLNIYNNKFTNIVNGYYSPLPMQKFYPEGAIYAVHNDLKLIPYNSIVVGGNGLKRNYFENCNTGVYSFQYLNTIDNNDAKNCVNGIRSLQLVHNSTYTNNIIYSTINHGVTSGYGIDLRNTHSDTRGIKCLVFDNQVINKRNGISLIGISGTQKVNRLVEVKNNIVNYNVSTSPYIPVIATESQIGIWIQNCHYSQIQLNRIERNVPALAVLEDRSVLGIRIAESRGANVFQNYTLRMGSGIYTNGLLTNTQLNCNISFNNYYGLRFDMYSNISNQGIPATNNPNNSWTEYMPQTNYKRMFAEIGCNPFNYYFDPSLGAAYDPTYNMPPSTIISYLQNTGASYLCINSTSPIGVEPQDPSLNLDAREAAYGQIVRNEKYYNTLEDQYKTKDREYVYEMLRKYPELINMGGEDDYVYLQYYNDGLQSDIEKVLKMREEMYEQNLAIAREKLAQIADDNIINTNRKIVDGIYLDTWANNNYEFTEEQEAALTTIAYLTPYAGGDAVYTARVMLNINPDEQNLDYAKAPSHDISSSKEITAVVFPNPAKDKVTVKFNDAIDTDANFELYGIMGNLVFSSTINKGFTEMQIDINIIRAGLYFYTVKVNNTKINSGKLTIISK